MYDHVIIFAPWSAQWGKGVSVSELIAFIDSGRNVLLAGDVVTEGPTRALAEAVGIVIEKPDGTLVDHFHYDTTSSAAQQHTAVLASVPPKPSPIVQTSLPGPVLYQGTAISLTDNPLIVPLLKAPSTSFVKPASGPVSDNQASLAGAPVLVAALQARNNARVVVTGSVDAFSNEAFIKTVAEPGSSPSASGNDMFFSSVVQWTFQLRGALRYTDISITLEDGTVPAVYTINDRITYSFSVMQWVDSAWVPYQAKDVQMEFVMLDPYLRAFMTPSTNGTFSHTFQAPDVYGVFTFNVDYRRLGYSNIVFQERIPVRPYRHDQYERFIVAAYPYYASALSMMVGLCFLSWFFLFHYEDPATAPKVTKTE